MYPSTLLACSRLLSCDWLNFLFWRMFSCLDWSNCGFLIQLVSFFSSGLSLKWYRLLDSTVAVTGKALCLANAVGAAAIRLDAFSFGHSVTCPREVVPAVCLPHMPHCLRRPPPLTRRPRRPLLRDLLTVRGRCVAL